MKEYAVLGGGPAGAFAAERLAHNGHRVVVFDEKLAWEKPCGGGLTYKAYSTYPFLLENNAPKRLIGAVRLAAPKAGRHLIQLTRPLLIYSRVDLNRLLLERAAAAGARVEKQRVVSLERVGANWKLHTPGGAVRANYCIIATGARNPLRQVGTRLTANDTMRALGYYVPGEQNQVDIQFLDGLEGYVWIFPRCGHLSVGIGAKGEPAAALRKRLERFLDEREIRWQGEHFYAHTLPSLSSESWRTNRVSGDGWLAVGDAGGLVDPITGEGLYYALRSADIATRILTENSRGPAEIASAYRSALATDFADDLAYGSRISRRLYLDRFWFGGVPSRMVELLHRSPHFREIMQDLFAGVQPYRGLKQRLLASVNTTAYEVILSFFFRRLLTKGESAA